MIANLTEARALLARLTLTGIRGHNTRTGYAWTATLRLDGIPVLSLDQAGNGGCNRYYPAKGTDPVTVKARDVKRDLELAATLCGLGEFESLDALTSAMVPKATGLDGVAAHLAYKREDGAAVAQ